MEERFKYAEVRQEIIDSIKKDLMGPLSDEEVLDESPKHAYIIGLLEPKTDSSKGTEDDTLEQEIDADISYEDDNDYTSGEDDENEPITTTQFQIPSSIGISFYISHETTSLNLDISWGDYAKSSEKAINKDGKEYDKISYKRIPMKETLVVDFDSFEKSKEYSLTIDSNVKVYVSHITLKEGYSLITAYIINRRTNASNNIEASMFQVNIRAYASSGENKFIAEHLCRKVLAADEFYFEQRPIMGRGRGCAASWGKTIDGKTNYVESDFIPQYEFPGVSAALPGFDKFFFSMRELSIKAKKENIIDKLNVLADTYQDWINTKLVDDHKMKDKRFVDEIGNKVIQECNTALNRIRDGIALLNDDEKVLDAFCFMNRAMLLQRNIMNYSKKHGSGVVCNFGEFVNPKNPNNDFGWRPFQIAFILMNLSGIVKPSHSDRDIVDLLYFPTGGGKTEAYLGLMAFTIANRRLSNIEDGFERDGGVTAILRYTLRLLTTQQRDRITKMVVAAEMIRQKENGKYGREPISIGFWVGGGVTPNKFDDLKENPEKPYEAKKQRNLIYKQLLNCPFCGKPLSEEEFYIDTDKKSVEIYCADKDCIFYKYNPERKQIPVYLVDEQIYSKCPTIILSTVDKFARLPWDPKTNAIFGRVDRLCSRDGYVAIGEDHPKHKKTESLPAASLSEIKPFLPPELIIQDELHLITGPLGTIYGAYETIIEDLSSYKIGSKIIKPKYVVSTATIKNAEKQTECLYARKETAQFPPKGFEIGDSFFIKEIPVENDPFRRYVGVCAPGQSVKTTLLRTYAIILQTVFELSKQEKYKGFIDPYYTLVGYYNSIRELGGAVRLLQDDIPKRMWRIVKKYGYEHPRYLDRIRNIEITSRMNSFDIPKKLNQLETPFKEKECLDTAVATNMIAVGMDVDRLGLMVVTGQPKQNSEYIQATSRIGRAFPGMVIALYNPYRPRDLSHYENFTGYHSQLYRFVEGTTATPFSARARDRVLHALIISAIRLKYPQFASNETASNIDELSDEQLNEVKRIILDRLNIIKPSARSDAEIEIDQFIEWWKLLSHSTKPLRYYVFGTDKYNRLMNYYSEYCSDSEKATLNSMREVESSANMYYYSEDI